MRKFLVVAFVATLLSSAAHADRGQDGRGFGWGYSHSSSSAHTHVHTQWCGHRPPKHEPPVASVPEPSAIATFGVGMLVVGASLRRRRK